MIGAPSSGVMTSASSIGGNAAPSKATSSPAYCGYPSANSFPQFHTVFSDLPRR